jgi:hypothetical protein
LKNEKNKEKVKRKYIIISSFAKGKMMKPETSLFLKREGYGQ